MIELRQEQEINNEHIDILIELEEHLSWLIMQGIKGLEPLKNL